MPPPSRTSTLAIDAASRRIQVHSAMTLQEQIDDMATEGPEQTEEQTDEDQRSSTPPSDDMDRILAGISDDIDEWHQ